MRIVVNHLTRMQHGYICVAGIDLDTYRHVRPQPEHDRWRKPDLVSRGGPFDVGAVVDLGRPGYIGRVPEVEDYQVSARRLRHCDDYAPADFWTLLRRVSRTRLTHIFGPDLAPQGRGFAVDEGKGSASLGCLTLAHPPLLHITARNEVRLSFTADPEGPSLKVTDLRLYAGEPALVRDDVVRALRQRMADGVGVILSVGLGRAWQKHDDTAPRHWLQVNNIHLEDDPLWQERQAT